MIVKAGWKFEYLDVFGTSVYIFNMLWNPGKKWKEIPFATITANWQAEIRMIWASFQYLVIFNAQIFMNIMNLQDKQLHLKGLLW